MKKLYTSNESSLSTLAMLLKKEPIHISNGLSHWLYNCNYTNSDLKGYPRFMLCRKWKMEASYDEDFVFPNITQMYITCKNQNVHICQFGFSNLIQTRDVYIMTNFYLTCFCAGNTYGTICSWVTVRHIRLSVCLSNRNKYTSDYTRCVQQLTQNLSTVSIWA